MQTHTADTDPYNINVLSYLDALTESLTVTQCHEHYCVLKLALLRLQSDDRAAFDLALQAIGKTLRIKAKTVKDDLASLGGPPPTKDARELLEKIGQTRPFHLAQDFHDTMLWYGVIAGEDKLLVNSNRELLTLDKIPDGLTVRDNGFDLCRFSKEGIRRFLNKSEESGHELLTDARTFFTRFALFRDTRIAALLAAWMLGTYCYRIFRVYPYLALRSPRARCGKSRVLDLLSLVAFNASPKTVRPTEAQLFRDPSRNGGTVLLDEVESLAKADKDNSIGILSVLDSGFEQNGTVQRQEKNANGNYHGVNFETFAPRALAGVNKTTDMLEDRSIIIVMQRKLRREKLERFSRRRREEEAQQLRDRCYIWALTHAEDINDAYDSADTLFPALDSLDDRARDLWEPLMSLVSLADAERGDGQTTLTDELTALAKDLCQVRDGAAEDSITVHIIAALQNIGSHKRQAGLVPSDKAVTLTPTDLANLLKEKLGWERLSTKTLATLLNPLGLFSKSTKEQGRVIKAYHLLEEDLSELQERYAPEDTVQDEK